MNKNDFKITIYNTTYHEICNWHGEATHPDVLDFIEFSKRYMFIKGMELSFEDFIIKFQAEIGGDIKNHLLKENIKQRVFSISSMYRNRFYINEPQHEVLDFANSTPIPKDDSDFHVFFAHRLRRIDNFNIEDFLNYHLLNTFKGNKDNYEIFIKLTIREHKELFENSSNYETILDYTKKIHDIPYSEIIKKMEEYGFEELFGIDKVFESNFSTYQIIEEILFEEEYLIEFQGKFKWNKQRKSNNGIINLTIIILLLKNCGFFNKGIFNYRKNCLKYRNAFGNRYQIDLHKYFQPKPRKIAGDMIKDNKYLFQFIQSPSKVIEEASRNSIFR